MCVIVHQTKNAHIDKETCRKLWIANPDGGGFAFVNDQNDVIVSKSMVFQDFWNHFEQARSRYPKRDYLLHLRIATHGSVKIENVHPFKVDDHTVMAHNGIIHGVPDYKDDRTDTAVYIDEVLPELPPTWLDSSYLFDMMETWLDWSKLMFITASPDLKLTVYRLGDWLEWEDGLWMTNLSGLVDKKPLVSTPINGAFYFPRDDSQSWDEWEKKREETTEYIGYRFKKEDEVADTIEVLPTWEADLIEDKLRADRRDMQIMHEVIIEDDGTMACYGCNAEIDPYTAECECWEQICMNCWQFVARCTTMGDCLTAGHVLYAELDTKEVEYVKQEITKVSRGLALVAPLDVPTGAANMKTAEHGDVQT